MSDYPIPYPLSVGTVHSGDWASSVPDLLVAEGRLGVRLGEDPARARAELEACVAEACAADPWLRSHPATVTWPGGQFASGRLPALPPARDPGSRRTRHRHGRPTPSRARRPLRQRPAPVLRSGHPHPAVRPRRRPPRPRPPGTGPRERDRHRHEGPDTHHTAHTRHQAVAPGGRRVRSRAQKSRRAADPGALLPHPLGETGSSSPVDSVGSGLPAVPRRTCPSPQAAPPAACRCRVRRPLLRKAGPPRTTRRLQHPPASGAAPGRPQPA